VIRTSIAAAALALTACGQSLPPLPESLFNQIAIQCDFRATSYQMTRSLLIEKPMIDFSREAHPKEAHKCFDAALQRHDREITDSSNPPASFGYVWDTQE
jgi:hypothetical protein